MCCDHIRLAFNADEACVQNNVLQAEEDNKKFKIQPPAGLEESFCRIHVDHEKNNVGLISDNNRKKCDYWFRRCSNEHNYFVEFKGSDIEAGFEQIIQTIVQVREKEISLPKASINGIVVANKVPQGADVQTLKERFRRHHGMDFIVKSKAFTLTLE